jgi:hypothetical protein
MRRLLAAAALTAAAALPAAAATAHTHARTASTVYAAFSYHGVVIPHVVSVQAGYCFESSLTTLRLDAWRCSVGNSTLDPCFSSEFANNVLCPTPWSDTAVEINLTKPLPKPTNHAVPSLKLAPWAIETATGADCLLTSGAEPTASNHDRMNYVCSANLGLWGYPDRRTEPWTIFSAPPSTRTLTHRAAILHAWM